MEFLNEIMTQVLDWFSTSLLVVLTPLLGPNVVGKWAALVSYMSGWNQLLPLASLFSIAFATFSIRMTVRIVRLVAGFTPTING